MKPMRSAAALAALVLLSGCATVAPDYAREQRLANEVTPSIVVGEAVQLASVSGHRFLGIYTAAAKPRAGVLLVHGMGAQPDFGLIGELRSLLADRGYTTLSIQMPVLASDARAEDYRDLFPEAGGRVAAGLADLRARGLRQVAIVAHSMGARMVNDYIVRQPDTPVTAWVAVAISDGRLGPLAGLGFPVFDIFAEKDFDAVLQGTKSRAAVLRRIRGSRQAMIYGADHYFGRKEKELASLIDQLLTPLVK